MTDITRISLVHVRHNATLGHIQRILLLSDELKSWTWHHVQGHSHKYNVASETDNCASARFCSDGLDPARADSGATFW